MIRRVVLLVDIGNTMTSLGLGSGRRVIRVHRTRTRMQNVTTVQRELHDQTQGVAIEGAILASVVPQMTPVWLDGLAHIGIEGPLLVSHKIKLGVGIDYPKPERIGADRLANATAAVERFGAPVVVADFGTALTFDVVTRDAVYAGGIIAPGLPLMTEYLAERTALLPHVKLQKVRHGVGKSTAEAMRIGAKVGYAGIVREIFTHLKKTLQERNLKICATGGYAEWALADTGLKVEIVPNLTLFGLRRIYDLNVSVDDPRR